MSVCYFQVLYKKTATGYQEIEENKSISIYKLYILSFGELFREWMSGRFNHKVFNFAGDENMVEVIGMPPLSAGYITPQAMLADLKCYEQLLPCIEKELTTATDKELLQELRLWSVDNRTISIMKEELKALTEVCNYAVQNKYVMKFGALLPVK